MSGVRRTKYFVPHPFRSVFKHTAEHVLSLQIQTPLQHILLPGFKTIHSRLWDTSMEACQLLGKGEMYFIMFLLGALNGFD